MSEVTCPRCHTRQAIGDVPGYTCVSCGASWVFATCENCGVRFHMRPGTTAWTCPECGHENGSAAMVDLGAGTEAAPEPATEDAGLEPTAPAPRHAAPPPASTRGSGPPTRARLATIAAMGIAAVLLVAFMLSAFGGTGGDAEGSRSPSASATTPAPSSSLTPTEALCLHVREGLQLLRVDNLTRLAATLANDQAAILAEGDAKLAKAVDDMRAAVIAYRDALAAQADITQASTQMTRALAELPCS